MGNASLSLIKKIGREFQKKKIRDSNTPMCQKALRPAGFCCIQTAWLIARVKSLGQERLYCSSYPGCLSRRLRSLWTHALVEAAEQFNRDVASFVQQQPRDRGGLAAVVNGPTLTTQSVC